MSGANKENDIPLQNPWSYFTRIEEGASAECKTCKKVVKTKSGNTSGLHNHLKKHSIQAKKVKRSLKELNVSEDSVSTEPQEKRMKLGEKLATEDSLPAMLARMTSKSGLTFKVFETDNDLCLCIQARLEKIGSNETLPKTDKTIKSYVMGYGERVKTAVMESFKLMRSKGLKFSLTFDEWTSIANKRYINVTVFAPFKMMWSLGLIKITGRATAYHLMELILERLCAFGIDFNDDVISITTDGASTMTKLGRDDSLAQHHLCLIHGVHLALLDILYVKDDSPETNNVAYVDASETDTVQDDETDENENDEGFNVVVLETAGKFSDAKIKAVITKIREVGSFFKRSPPSNEILQDYVKSQFNDPMLEMRLKVDCKTRWNSLYEMLDRYWRIKECVDKALIDVKHKISISAKDKFIISCILITLRPVMNVVKNLSCRDSNLVKARISFIMLFKQLMKKPNPLTEKFLRRLYCRIHERWTINYQVLTYLHTGSLSNEVLKNNFGSVVSDDTLYDFAYDEEAIVFEFENYDFDDPASNICFLDMFKIPSRHAIKAHIKELVKRLYQPVESDEIPVLPERSTVQSESKSFEELLNEAMADVDATDLGVETSDFSQLGTTLTAELNHFEKKKVRIGYVQKIYDALMTTKPSSVESERAFSLASYLCSKLRSRLNDNTLDTLCFLRSFFRNPHIFDGTLD